MENTRDHDARGDSIPPDTCPLCGYRHNGKCEPEAALALHECRCEQNNCHGTRGCARGATLTVHTLYGGFEMCPQCAQHMPDTYRTMPDTLVY